MRIRTLAAVLSAVGLWGCAQAPVADVPPTKPSTPSALVSDDAEGGGRSGGRFFYLGAVDGQAIDVNSLTRSVRASVGRGSDLQILRAQRYVAAGRHQLTLKADFAYAAPVQYLFGSRPASYEGTVEVTLEDGARYRVTGRMDAYLREVWIENADTGARVGAKVVGPVDASAAATMATADYTCCNLHYEDDWISDANWSDLPMIPAGARIFVQSAGPKSAEVLIEGRPMRLGLDYGRAQSTMSAFLQRLVVTKDPRLAIDAMPTKLQDAVRAGQVALGMSREQAVIALGYPRQDETPTLDGRYWKYSTVEGEAFVLVWGADGLLADVEGVPDLKRKFLQGYGG